MNNFSVLKRNSYVVRYEAYVYRGGFQTSCSVKADIQPLQCAVDGLRRGTRYTIHARACLPGSLGCGPDNIKPASTKYALNKVPSHCDEYAFLNFVFILENNSNRVLNRKQFLRTH